MDVSASSCSKPDSAWEGLAGVEDFSVNLPEEFGACGLEGGATNLGDCP
jgi:hypothetical protein